MRYRTFLVTGVEVLQLGGQYWESNAWPLAHWRTNRGRWRLFMPALDDFVSSELQGMSFGPAIDSLVVVLEIADFAAWPADAFARPDAPHSYKPKHKELWCVAKLNWPDVMDLTLSEQYRACVSAVLASVKRIGTAPRKPRGLDVDAMHDVLAAAFSRGKPSRFTRAARPPQAAA